MAFWMLILAAIAILRMSTAAWGWPSPVSGVAEENRIPSPWPDFARLPSASWGRAIDAWLNDSFPFRKAVVGFYRHVRFHALRCPFGDRVPGDSGTIFLRGGTWPEIDDYLGAISLGDEMKDDWRTLIEGRTAWAEAHGARYLEVVTPVKIQVHPEHAPWTVKRLPGQSSRKQLEAAMRGSFAESNIVFLTGRFRAAAMEGQTLFYSEDHHVNALGCWMVYDSMAETLRRMWFPQLTKTPYFDNPPDSVAQGLAAGAFTDPASQRLVVSAPGYSPRQYRELDIVFDERRYPSIPVRVRRKGDGLKLAMRHDSFLRFPLSSWRRGGYSSLAIPLGDGFNDIAMFIFKRFSTAELDKIAGAMAPDVIVEQFPECKISLGTAGLDDTMRRAAAFGRAGTAPNTADGREGRYLAMASFSKIVAGKGPGRSPLAVVLDADGRQVATAPVAPGLRRAIFFGEIAGRPPFKLRISNGKAARSRLEIRR